MAVTRAWQYTDVFDTSSTTGQTFTSVPFGTATSTRYILVCVLPAAAVTISGVTIGGVAATLVFASASELNGRWYIANVTSGTSGSVVVTWATTDTRVGINVWRVEGILSTTPSDTLDTGAAADPATGTLDVYGGGAAFGSARNALPDGAHTWTGLTEDADNGLGTGNNLRITAASGTLNSEAGRTITCDTSNICRMSAISYAPLAVVETHNPAAFTLTHVATPIAGALGTQFTKATYTLTHVLTPIFESTRAMIGTVAYSLNYFVGVLANILARVTGASYTTTPRSIGAPHNVRARLGTVQVQAKTAWHSPKPDGDIKNPKWQRDRLRHARRMIFWNH